LAEAAKALEERKRCRLSKQFSAAELAVVDEVDTIHGFEACATALAGVGLRSTWPKA